MIKFYCGLLLALLVSCGNTDESLSPPSYQWKAATVSWALVYPDSIVNPPDCYVDYEFGKDYGRCDNHTPSPYEGGWNCTGKYMERRGDTVFIRAFAATGPDEDWRTSFKCTEQYEPFVLQSDGHGVYVGTEQLASDPEVRLKGDSLTFKMTFTVFDRGFPYLIEEGSTPDWVLYHQYGFVNRNLDSMQTLLNDYCEGRERYCEYPDGGEVHYMVGWREFIYVASDSVLTH